MGRTILCIVTELLYVLLPCCIEPMPSLSLFFLSSAVRVVWSHIMSQNMSEADVTALKELLQRCRAAGCLNRVFGELGEDVGELFEEQFDEVQGHVIVQMSDASKRRLSPETFSRSCRATNQMPVMPAAKAQAQASSRVEEFSLDPANIPFPDDVVDMKDWGTTIMQTGKFAGPNDLLGVV